MVDPSGAITTAAAMIAVVERHLRARAAIGPAGRGVRRHRAGRAARGVIAAQAGAKVCSSATTGCIG